MKNEEEKKYIYIYKNFTKLCLHVGLSNIFAVVYCVEKEKEKKWVIKKERKILQKEEKKNGGKEKKRCV